MSSAAKALMMVLALVASAQASAQALSEAAVKAFLVKFDRAIAAKNATEVGRYLSETVQVSIGSRGGAQSSKMDKAQYLAALRDTWAMSSNNVYRRSNENIVISGNVATISADVFESMVVVTSSQHITVRSKQVATLELINGELLLTKVVGRGSASI